MKTLLDVIFREIKADRTTGAVELVKRGVDALTLFITCFTGERRLRWSVRNLVQIVKAFGWQQR